MIILQDILSQEIIQRLGWTLLHFIWQATAVVLILAILLRLLRKSTANLRYIIACFALALIVLLPLITIQLVPVSASNPAISITPSPVPTVLPIVEMPAPETIVVAKPSQPESVNVAPAVSLKQRITDTFEPSLPYIVSGWLIGVFGLSIWHLGGWTQLQRLKRRMVKQVDSALQGKLKVLCQKLKVKQTVQLMESALVQIPTVVGWLRPVILLPASALTGLNTEQLEAIIAHELAHIKRFDYLINILQTIVEILGFYHPAVWWVSYKIRAERENCCDDMAVGISGDRVSYAGALASMEEIRTGHGKLAVAAGGGNLFRRICRLLGKDSTDSTGLSWIPAATAILLIIALAIPTTLTLTARAQEKPEDLSSAVIKGIRQNRDKFECGYLAWSSKQINNRFADSDHPAPELAGQYELWWDGKKIATKYVRDQVYKDPEGRYRIEEQQGGTSYDGGVLSRKPDFHSDNWLGPNITRWRGQGSQDWLIWQDIKQEEISKDWSVIDNNGVKLIRVIARNMNEKARDYGAYSIRDYDSSKGYGLVNEEWYNPDGSPRLKHTVKMLEVISGGWFPVEVDFKSFGITDGRVYTHSHYALDIERCSFNDRSALPNGIFKLGMEKQLKYQEDLQKYLVMELEGLSDVKETAKTNKVKCGAREAIEKFIAASIAGDLEKAGEYAHPDRLPANQIADITEIAKGQKLWIMAVIADEFSAIAVSSVIQGDHDRTGPLVFSLDRVTLDGRNNWWIHDIDLKTPDGAEGELKQFLEKHPEAEKIQPAEQDEDDIQNLSGDSEKKSENQIETQRVLSAQKLKQLGLAVAMYADDNNDNLPESIQKLRPYIQDRQDFDWLLANVEYVLKETTFQPNRRNIPVAYDKTLNAQQSGTNVLFLDGHVEFVTAQRLSELDLERAKFLIETWILEVSKDFIQNIDQNADSTDEAKELIKLKPMLLEAVDGPNKMSFIPPEHNIDLLLKALRSHKDSKIIAHPQIICQEGKSAKITTAQKIPILKGYTEPNSPSENPKPKFDQVEEGITISLRPNLTPNNNIYMQLELEITQVLDFEELVFEGKTTRIPQKVETISQGTKYTAKNDQPMLFGGHKVVKMKDGQTEEKDLLILVKAQTVGSPEQDKTTQAEKPAVVEARSTTTKVISPSATAKSRSERIEVIELTKTEPVTEKKPQMVQKSFKLKYQDASQIARILRPLLTNTGHISTDERTNSLIIIDTVENLVRIEKAIAQFDAAKDDETVTEIFELRHGEPVEIVELLKKLINGRPENGAIIEQGKEPIVLIPEPRRKWIIAKASAENIKQIGQWIKKLDTDKTIGMDPIDAAVYEQLETIVDLSDLGQGTSFGEVIEKLKNSVEPPLQIQPIWKDLLENAEVEQATPAGMDPLPGIKLHKALEILLASVTTSQLGESAKPTYIVDDGVIVIGTGMLPQKTWIEKLDTDKTIGMDPIDAAVYEQLETIIDLSDLSQGTSFGKVIEKLKNSVEPPLQIQPIWKDLLENAEIEQATPAGMDPLPHIKLRKALEILLASVTTSQLGESAKPTYIVDDGVIVIGTAEMLPTKVRQSVQETSDSVEIAVDTAQSTRKELEKTTPEIKQHEMQILRQQYINNDLRVKSLFEKVTEVENELIELRQQYTPSHPEIRIKASLLRAYKNALQERKKEVGESFDEEMTKEIHKTNQEEIKKLLDELQEPNLPSAKTVPLEEPVTPLEQIQKQLDELIKQQQAHKVMEPNIPSAPKVRLISSTFVDDTLINALQTIARLGRVTIIPDETVKGLVSCKLKDVTVEVALDIILAGTPYIWKKTPHYYLVASGGVATLEEEPSEITERMESAKKLSKLGKALLIYANDHNDKYPISLHHLGEYLKIEEYKWVVANVEYLAHGKTLADRPETVVAYDKKLLREGKGTNVLYNDCHVSFMVAEELKKLDIERRILINTKILSVSEDFLKDVGLDANPENLSDAWRGHLAATYPTGPNGKPYGLMIDDLHVNFLLRALGVHEDAHIISSPQVLCLEGKSAQINIMTDEYYYKNYKEPNNLTDENEPNVEKVEIGTRIWLTPKMTEINRGVKLDFKLEHTQLEGIIEGKYKDKYPIYKPIIDVASLNMPCTIPDGKSMLIGGLKITEYIKKEPNAFIGEMFKRGLIRNDKMLLILIKPTINPQQKATKVLPGQEDSEEDIRRLAEQLDKKIKSPVN